MLECKRCGYKWQARVEKPKACPRCLSRKWDEARGKKGGEKK